MNMPKFPSSASPDLASEVITTSVPVGRSPDGATILFSPVFAAAIARLSASPASESNDQRADI